MTHILERWGQNHHPGGLPSLDGKKVLSEEMTLSRDVQVEKDLWPFIELIILWAWKDVQRSWGGKEPGLFQEHKKKQAWPEWASQVVQW